MVRKDLVKDQKWLEKIQIKNDVVFCTVFLDEEDCRELLQRILGMHIVKLKVVLNQKAIQNNIFQKGTRLDIYAEDDKGNMYDIEMQLTKTRELVPRSRYYHCEMDGHQIATGETYEAMKIRRFVWTKREKPFLLICTENVMDCRRNFEISWIIWRLRCQPMSLRKVSKEK